MLVRRGPQGTGVRVGAANTSYGTTSEIDFVPPAEVDLMDVSPKQIVSVSTALIPFVEHDDANRALMGANMQKQAVPLVVPEAPYIGTGVEARAARDAGDVIMAEGDGTVVEVSGDQITVEYKAGAKDRHGTRWARRSTAWPSSAAPTRTRPSTRRSSSTRARRSSAGDVLADGPATHNGELALGKNLLVAFMPWEGYNYEDAIILSERLVQDDVLTSIHIEEHEVDARDTKLGRRGDHPGHPEPLRGDPGRPRRAGHHPHRRRGRRRATCWSARSPPRARPSRPPRSACCAPSSARRPARSATPRLKVPHGEQGKVIDVRVFSREDAHELPPGRRSSWSGSTWPRSARSPRATSSPAATATRASSPRSCPIEDMPFQADGTPVDIILNPLGVPSRMNVGQVLESHLGYAARWGWEGAGDDGAGTPLRGTETQDPAAHRAGRVGLDAGVRRRPLGRGGRGRPPPDDPADLPEAEPRRRATATSRSTTTGKSQLYNGRTGEAYDNPVSVGYVYILKLHHLVDDKIHARSTGPYSMITQQPLGGKAQFGGQRFGEMEVWALEAFGAAYALQELLTIKSDDVLGRVKVYEAIVKGENIPEPGIPESFKVLIKEMQSLCLDVEVLAPGGEEIEMRELDEDVFRTAEELGIDISRPERGSDEEDARRAAERGF